MNDSAVAQLASSIKTAFMDALPSNMPMDVRNSISASYENLCTSMAQSIRVFTETAITEAVNASKAYTNTKDEDHVTTYHADTDGDEHIRNVSSAVLNQMIPTLKVDIPVGVIDFLTIHHEFIHGDINIPVYANGRWVGDAILNRRNGLLHNLPTDNPNHIHLMGSVSV